VFVLPATIAPLAGVISPWLFLAVCVLIISLVLTFAELASYFNKSGGPVLYTTEAFGPVVGYGAGWLYYISRTTAFAGNAHVMAVYLGALWPWLEDGTGKIVAITFVCVGLTLANLSGAKSGIRTLAIFSFLKVMPLLVLILLGLQYVTPETLFPKSMPVIDDFGGVSLLLLYAYVGFETALITAGETDKPKTTIPRALIYTVLSMGLLYFLVMLVYVSIFSGSEAQGATLVDVGQKIAGPIGAIVITLTAIFSINGNLSGTMFAAPRLTYAMAEQNLLPEWFMKLRGKNASPVNSIMFFSAACTALALSGTFILLAISTSLARLIIYILCILALPVIKRRASEVSRANSFKVKGGYLIPIISLIICCWAASHSSFEAVRLIIGLLIIGFIPYIIKQRALRK
ncbi:MAG: APC family permease, partial [Kordiimonadaceae bacterium]|nr:APC family permease [Kordiimonadaceae bacterium]